MTKALTQTDFHFNGQKSVYHGKVRDVYNINDDLIVMVATDRISAFDVVLPKGIPFKGQVLNQIAAKFLDTTTDICPNWKLATPDPMVTVGLKCEGFKVEMIIRSILTGSAWRAYKDGCRELCGVKLPEGMRENERFPEPIITPTTKADEGHDLNISKEEIIAQGIMSREDYEIVEDYTRKIFQRGQEIAKRQGLILVDTKYEFGKRDGKIYLTAAGGIPTYPFLADDAKGNFTDFEEDLQKCADILKKRGIRSCEFITTRNTTAVLEKYAGYLVDEGFVVTFGSEHNTPALEPIRLRTRDSQDLSDRLKEINWRGACLVAAHQNGLKTFEEGEEIITKAITK